jgi:lyso-ornithine lipid O-acyltransferase
MTDWREARTAPWRPGPLGWLLVLVRGTVIGVVTYGCLVILLLVRLVEAPLFAPRRPLTPWITQFVCRTALLVIGLRLVRRGQPMTGEGAIVANHSSWLDIFVLNACDRIYFVSKSEVAGWAGIGWLARATGTVFIARKGSEAKAQADLFETRLHAQHRLLFFPEGTSTDAIRVMPFKSTLFAAFFAEGLRDRLRVQPVSVVYHPPPGQDPRFYGWWGEMSFAPHFLHMLATLRHAHVEVTFHDPVAVAAFPDRKALAAHCEAVIRSAHDEGLPKR